MVDESLNETFNALVMTKIDFALTEKMTKPELDFIWELAKDKFSDFIMQDYDLVMNSFIEYGLSLYREKYHD